MTKLDRHIEGNSNAKDDPDEIMNIKLCGRCYEQTDKLFPANCNEKPEKRLGEPIGMYHCPECGAMVIAGLEHPMLCKRCLDRKHPGYDEIEEKRS